MSDKPTLFEARDLSPAFCADRQGNKKYAGPDRRRLDRRSNTDRRATVRFDPQNEDRRLRPGRREDDTVLRFW
ncbi:MAG: hypothetical protein CME43_00085 [Haliea sp.]|uniref:hypothetical protein n=1 Tax=Haliea sp. TaxID=1932666 RepID=UPI000C6B15FD|nr:hypothetical protein [Haliea sp.]MBM67862.1 hypothetical protein [Haliea sp.]|tara:strand:+ start:15373 stop:15591 length:219 start_codon:yes stop_codon:yes gene_type:complete